MQDIGWGQNILEDWKLDEGGGGGGVNSCFCFWGKSKSPDRRYGRSDQQAV